MNPQGKSIRSWGLAILALVAGAASARADAMYTVRDLGADPYVELTLDDWNRAGLHYLSVNDSGKVAYVPPNYGAYTGPFPAGAGSLVEGIVATSPNGQYVAGTTSNLGGPWQGFIEQDGIATPVGSLSHAPSTAYSDANAVNNSGLVAGASGTTNPYYEHAYVTTASGKLIDLGTLGGVVSSALGINGLGTVVGLSYLADGSFHGFVSDGHSMTDLNSLIASTPGLVIASATGINDLGQIAAYGRFATDPAGFYHELLLSPKSLGIPPLDPIPQPPTAPISSPQVNPVPEPTTAITFGLLASAMAMRLRARSTPKRRG